MDISPPQGWKQISKEEFQVLLGLINWKRDAFGNAQIYLHVNSGQRFAWESAGGDFVFVDPSLYRQEGKKSPMMCCGFPMVPRWRISAGREMSPRYVATCDTCKKEHAAEVDQAARDQLRYALVNNLLEVDDEEQPQPAKEQYVPEGVKVLSKMMEGEGDNSNAMRLWFEFRYAFKRAVMAGKQMGWDDIIALVDASIKRTRKTIKSAELRNQIIGRFIVMRKRCEEFKANPEATQDKCEKCDLPRFICPCPKEPLMPEE